MVGCDGIWDVMINEEVGDYVCLRMFFFDDLELICSEFFDICLVKVRLLVFMLFLISFVVGFMWLYM